MKVARRGVGVDLERDEVDLAQEHLLRPILREAGVRRRLLEQVVEDDAHVERVGAPGDRAADAPQPDDAKRLAVHVDAGLRISRASPRGLRGGRKPAQLAGNVNDKPKREVGHRLRDHVGGVADQHACPRRRRQVHVVVPNPNLPDGPHASP